MGKFHSQPQSFYADIVGGILAGWVAFPGWESIDTSLGKNAHVVASGVGIVDVGGNVKDGPLELGGDVCGQKARKGPPASFDFYGPIAGAKGRKPGSYLPYGTVVTYVHYFESLPLGLYGNVTSSSR
jgi:hypothetical protein